MANFPALAFIFLCLLKKAKHKLSAGSFSEKVEEAFGFIVSLSKA